MSSLARAAQFAPELLVVDLDLPAATAESPTRTRASAGRGVNRTIVVERAAGAVRAVAADPRRRGSTISARSTSALVTGPRDYVGKNGFRTVVIGLSGGIDSALVATIACDALGADERLRRLEPQRVVHRALAHRRRRACRGAPGSHLDTVADRRRWSTHSARRSKVDGLAEENLQARVRGVVLMALSNQYGHLVLATGNKSELATGYSTIYGDAVGGFAPIKDVPKTLVWALSRWRNAEASRAARRRRSRRTPSTSRRRPSSGRASSTRDSLPDYDMLDAVLDDYVEQDQGSAELLAAGFDPALVERVIAWSTRRSTSGGSTRPGRRSRRSNFGRDRRVPITNRWREQL